MIYRGEKRNQISFPLGGIGTGCVGLSGTGRLIDWEIFNRPSKGSLNGFTHFAVKAEKDGHVLDARVLNADLPAPYTGNVLPGAKFRGYGFGPERYLMAGVPHFRDCEFDGKFPTAEVRFLDESFPAKATLSAFNPMIPLNDKDSGMPAAFFTVSLQNSGKEPLDYSVCMTVFNPYEGAKRNVYTNRNGAHLMTLSSSFDKIDTRFGDMTFGVSQDEEVSYQEYWYRGSWFDNLSIFWREFSAPGGFKNRTYPEGTSGEDHATLCARFRLMPGEERSVRFVLTWNHPNNYNDWSDHPGAKNPDGSYVIFKNYYATLFENSNATALYALNNWDALLRDTLLFRDALFSSSLPEAALDAVTANISLIKSPTVWRLEDGTLYGWEGVMTDRGSCEGTCQHVWNYAYALPYLFPPLERTMREADYKYNMREDGGMAFRLFLPLGSGQSGFRPCVDGQMGGVIKTYREWKISGDDQWLKKLWPDVKKSLEFAWSQDNRDRWDPDKSGVMTGRQHHTLDMELFGANAWLNGFYLAALKAAGYMARAVGDPVATDYERIFERGKAWSDEHLFEGEYYVQRLNLTDKSILEAFEDHQTLTGHSTVGAYWNDEAQEIKYQVMEGCGIDQVLAQWHADLVGLGEVFDSGKVDSALRSIYRYNFKPSLRHHFNPCRIYGLNDEAGCVICEWPEGKYKPAVPVPYSEECMHGFEYQAAIHMILRGMEKEGMDIVKGVRDRYDGEKRNPYNEMECGSNYARSMATYALLLAYSGFSCDKTRGFVGFRPIRDGAFFWSMDGAWGVFEQAEERAELKVLYGSLALKAFGGSFAGASFDGRSVACSIGENEIIFEGTVELQPGQTLLFTKS